MGRKARAADAGRERAGRGVRAAIGVAIVAALVGTALAFPWETPGNGTARPAPGGTTAGGSVVIAPAFVPGPSVERLGPVPAALPMAVEVGLAPRDPTGLEAMTTLEYTPGTVQYHHFLNVSTVAERFGPTADTYATAQAYFAGTGLSTTTSPDRLTVYVQGPAAAIGRAFGTSFEEFRANGRSFVSHLTPAVLPAGLPWSGAVGLGNVSPPRPDSAVVPGSVRTATATPDSGCPSSSPYAPCSIAEGYNVSSFYAAGENGSGVRIGVVDVYDGTENQTTLASDLATFTSDFKLPASPVAFVYPVPTPRNLNRTNSGWGLEEALDLEWSRALAPGATIDMTFAPDPTAGLYASVDWLVAHQAVDVISLSWGENDVGVYNAYSGACASACNATADGSYTLLHPVLAEAAAEGIGVFSASGDCGAAAGTSGLSTDYPASDPWVTGVGGTLLTLLNGGWSSETGWSGNESGATSPGCGNQGGSGGGFAPFPRPPWQAASGLPSSPSTRGVPDVALVAASTVQILYNGFTVGVGGTSAACPMWAGLEAVADGLAGGSLGDLAPSLYTTARSLSASSAFHDITGGWNGYSAGTGWDPVTGLGTPDFGQLEPTLTAGAPASSSLSVDLLANPRVGPVGLNATFHLSESGVAGSIALADLDFGDGNATVVSGSTGSHVYLRTGVFVVRATVFDTAGDSAVSPPIVVVVGGGHALSVTLNVSSTSPAVGATVTFRANASGGAVPYTFEYTFGDGTYLTSPASVVNHTFGSAGAFCAAVVAVGAGAPPSGGVSDQEAVTVGGPTPASCQAATALNATFTVPVIAADLPGDLPFDVNTTGGVPPISVRYTTDDPYVNACSCGIFSVPGNHTVVATVDDSLNQEVTATVNVTLYPRLVATFGHTSLTGPTPLSVDFSAAVSGGYEANASAFNWTFGDGGAATGANVTHVFATAGPVVVRASVTDGAGGTTGATFLVDPVAPTDATNLSVGAAVGPSAAVPAGGLVTFMAFPTGGTGPYTVRWDLGDGDSAFGATVEQTYAESPCLLDGSCPLTIGLAVTDAAGTNWTGTIVLTDPVAGVASALSLAETIGPTAGSTPLRVNVSAGASGPPGLPPTVGIDFGDGTLVTGSTATHLYLSPGNFTVTVTATSPLGDALVRTRAVAVVGETVNPPSVVGGPDRASGLAPLPIDFAVAAANGTPPYEFAWAFGDGTTGAGPVVNHTYGAGAFNASVTMTDAAGETASATYAIAAYSPFEVGVALVVDRSTVGPGGTVTVTATATARCGPVTPPDCASADLALRVTVGPSGGPPTTVVPATTGPTGVAVVPVSAPTVPGVYLLNVSAVGPNATGGAELPLTVAASPSTAATGGFPLGPPLLVGAVAVVAAAAVVVAWAVVRRRRRGDDDDAPE